MLYQLYIFYYINKTYVYYIIVFYCSFRLYAYCFKDKIRNIMYICVSFNITLKYNLLDHIYIFLNYLNFKLQNHEVGLKLEIKAYLSHLCRFSILVGYKLVKNTFLRPLLLPRFVRYIRCHHRLSRLFS